MAKVAILGSGNAACTYSAYLGKRGHEVHLYDAPRFESNLTPIREYGGMDMEGADTGFGPISMVTTDIEEAVKGVKVLMVVLPAFGHKPMAEQLAPCLEDGQIIVLNPGAVFGALEFLNTLRKCGCQKDIMMGELASNIFACRRVGPTRVNIFGKKAVMETACIPASRTEEMIRELSVFFPDTYVPVPNVIHTSLSYTNLVIHPAGSILNMGRIEWTHGHYRFYWEGLTPGVCRNIERVDAERVAVGAALGAKLETGMDIFHRYYGHPERKTFYDFFSKSEVNDSVDNPASAPTDLKSRYITEDFPYALVPLMAVGKAAGVETPVMDSLTTLASVANEEDYRSTGRTLESLGLDGLSPAQIVDRFVNGV